MSGAVLVLSAALGFGLSASPRIPTTASVARASPRMAHALIVQNKGGGHGEIGFHLAKALRVKGVEVTFVQDPAAKKAKLPFSQYESELSDCNVVWCAPTDAAAILGALAGREPLTHVFENNAKGPSDIAPALAAALVSPVFKLFAFVSSGGMYTKKGALSEEDAIKNPPTGQREVELYLAEKLPGKWCAFRPQYIYGPYTNKREYLDWFLQRASRGLPMPLPGDGTQPASLTHCEDVASLLASVAGQEDKAADQVFNCAASASLTYTQIAEIAASATGKPANIQYLPAGTKTSFPLRPNKEGFYVSVGKAQSTLGWAPKHDVAADLGKDGFYSRDYFALGLDKGEIDTSQDLALAPKA
ncbi:hypothetical protein T492DRAFT_990713 [Pavlovales sp. CCMP2436]|nr:hypothetical protein T492DRAFT_990713 [Pavlovales sp. CCMP2436]|mmetsp:Transcript_22455/g.56972  ORF Transcript_22455/g.56972 Transcript_22455/m.56972 type:complete len:359 (-) Transcript_22455:202-1278(-)|eukprot:CAMPEP_0179956600 /NCGR_PEP_ID=MMETSP0983-20121128/26977_1 /TAXON_ID=483367 /ORGANISM="non described non described, Strain CCMP 2436" /LENGTH=358 /DNA_ID=CAMNT_0021868461 /DNA_START=21 /DNA_END=1097 /DNA_ORIENTATION=+